MRARFLLWRLLGLLALGIGLLALAWFLSGGAGDALRGHRAPTSASGVREAAGAALSGAGRWVRAASAPGGRALGLLLGGIIAAGAFCILGLRVHARRRRRYVRLRVSAYRADRAIDQDLVRMFESLHQRLLRRWWRRLLWGQPSVSLEAHVSGHAATPAAGAGPVGAPGGAAVPGAWLAVTCPAGHEAMVESALRGAYPNLRLTPTAVRLGSPPYLLRLKKRTQFIKRILVLERHDEPDAPMNRLLTVMAAAGGEAVVQLALTPAPALFEHWARRQYQRHERRLVDGGENLRARRDRSEVDTAELRGGLDVQHRPLFFADLRVIAARRRTCEQVASQLRAQGSENRLIERGTTVRQGLLGLYDRRVARGEGNPLPSFQRGVFASTELPGLWQMPTIDFMTVPFDRAALPLAPAPPAILRPLDGRGCLRDALGPVSIHPELRRQNTAVPGTVEQGKSSYLVATVAEDLRRERCAIIVLDPKGDAAAATVGLIAPERTCTLLDFSHPTCGFNPLAVHAPPDVIADYVVGALRNLFTEADIRASSDRYLRNAIIAVLGADAGASLWDVARVLSVGEEGTAFRGRIATQVRGLPEFKEISEFFTSELTTQLADSRSTTTAKLDAPVNKLARLLNSASIKRVLLNDSLSVDFDRIISGGEVLVVRGALGEMGAGNTSVLMQLLVGMLDAALARQQDRVAEADRVAVALKIDEAPLVVNRGFAQTLALKRSAGLETVACWQSDAQWTDEEVRDQLDALFAHRVCFATASVRDARDSAALMMAEFSDTVRSGDEGLSALGRPDVRLHLPKHHAIVSWTTPRGRQAPFVARTLPMEMDPGREAWHARRQDQRGGRYLADLRQPHWDRARRASAAPAVPSPAAPVVAPPAAPVVSPPTAPAVRVPTTPAAPSPAPPAARAPEAPAMPSPTAAAPRAKPAPAAPVAGVAAESYRELADMDGAHRVRWSGTPAQSAPDLVPDELDLQILLLLARLRHVLSSQIHRRFNSDRASTTTQRRLKRLETAGWIGRFQFHRPDGGGVPMCCVITEAGLELLRSRGALSQGLERSDAPTRTAIQDATLARRARHEVHVTAWVLAAEQLLKGSRPRLRGAGEALLSPSARSGAGGPAALGPTDLRLPGGRTAHDFQRTEPDGRRLEAARFETVRPDAALEVRAGLEHGDLAVDLLVAFEDRLTGNRAAAKLERYDHFVSGWALHTQRYGPRGGALPAVVFVCRDAARARECARRADALLTACRAYAGEYPSEWEYPGREQIVFAAERDAHEGLARAYGVAPLPPEVRVTLAAGDPAARASEPLTRNLLSIGLAGRRS